MIRKYIETKKGKICIESKLTADRLHDLIFASDFTCQSQYKAIYTQKKTLEQVAQQGGSVSIALLDNKTIVGFAALDAPDANGRWASIGPRIALELKAVEVLREFRNQGVARQLLTHLFSDLALDEKIVYLTAYSWIWDLDYSGLNIQSYRKILLSLYTGFGFIEYPTNEPNICLRPENIFMARVGKTVPKEVQDNFKWLRFGVFVN